MVFVPTNVMLMLESTRQVASEDYIRTVLAMILLRVEPSQQRRMGSKVISAKMGALASQT